MIFMYPEFKRITLEKALSEYLNIKKGLKPQTKQFYSETVSRYLHDWKERRLVTITKQEVADRHRAISSHAPYCANRAMDIFQAVWNFTAIEHPEMPRNPAEIYRKQGGRNKEVRRKQDLKSSQIPHFWHALNSVDPIIGLYLRIIYFTGMRRRECIRLRWQDVDWLDLKITINETKNSCPLILPITEQLKNLLDDLHSYRTSEWLFASRRTTTHWQEPRKAVERVRAVSGVHFTVHSLRNTFITVAKRQVRLPDEEIKALVNHSVGNDVTEGYAAPLGVNDLRNPAQLVADRLESLTKEIDSKSSLC